MSTAATPLQVNGLQDLAVKTCKHMGLRRKLFFTCHFLSVQWQSKHFFYMKGQKCSWNYYIMQHKCKHSYITCCKAFSIRSAVLLLGSLLANSRDFLTAVSQASRINLPRLFTLPASISSRPVSNVMSCTDSCVRLICS